ncbi:CBS domain-containing protein [Pikeienuella sp. HZG-20]|uniref:CBS domain-containing protein n=1 Tax=Paludibacillus litoralis TaxID=3133267 RepID=UPI0030EB906C
MKVREVLLSKGDKVMTVSPRETVDILAHRLRLADVGALIVSDDGEKMLGIVSERDIVACLAQDGAEAHRAKVSDIMSSDVVTCSPDDQLSAIARKMTARRIRHIPVVDRGRLAGMISIGDIVKHRLTEIELEAGVLRDVAMAAR